MSFKNFINEQTLSMEHSRVSYIAKINLYHKEFINLDSVTFSRWVNGRTVPSLFKQILLCLFFKTDVMTFIKNKNYTITSKGKKLEDTYTKTMRNISNSIVNINYSYSRDTTSKYQVSVYKKNEYRKKYAIFYNNFTIYKDFLSKIDSLSIIPITLTFEELRNNHIVGHDSISYVSKENKKHFCEFFNITLNDIDDFWFANIGFHSSSNSFKLALTVMFYFLYYQKKDDYLSLIRGEEAFHNLTEIGYQQIGKTMNDHGENIYLARCNIFKAMSHPFVISEMSDILNKYDIDSFFSREIKDEYFKR
ncbi:TPA: hypothetical protein ACX6Q1_001070 [Photobacterium damselae]